jgi:2,3-bisphosphoglycerate-independent phosphoglycerate mutase
MKYVIIVPDGMAGYPLKKLSGRTTMEAAKTPNMDFLAAHGTVGMTNNTPSRFTPASDIANMSILGIDPEKYHLGRGPLEALSQNIPLKKGQLVFRINFVTIKKGKMVDFTAGHIGSPEAARLLKYLAPRLQKKFRNMFYIHKGVSYRNMLIFNQPRTDQFEYTPPHNITGKAVKRYWPNNLMGMIMKEAEILLKAKKANPTQATHIWLWGQGHLKAMPQLKKRFGVSGAMITAVDLLKGLGKSIGMEVIKVPGITGYFDTNYAKKGLYALKALKNHDLVFIHIEAPDEAGHEGNIQEKIRAIENIDRKIIGPILKKMKGKKFRIMVLPDHRTPIKLKTHTSDDVPFVIYSPTETKAGPKTGFNERTAQKSNIRFKRGFELIAHFIKL